MKLKFNYTLYSLVFILSLTLLGCASNTSGKLKSRYYKVLLDKVVWVDRNSLSSNSKPYDISLELADTASFTILKQKEYAKDKKRVFYQGYVIPLADPISFKLIAKGFAIDANYAYVENKIIEGADPLTFTVLKSGTLKQYSKDRTNVYLAEKSINPCDLSSFKFFKNVSFNWSRDDQCIYYNDDKLKGVDAENFKFIRYDYSSDGKKIYYADKHLSEANASSFQYQRKGNFDATDGKLCYMRGNLVSCNNNKKITKLSSLRSESEIQGFANRVATKWLSDANNAKNEAGLRSRNTQTKVVANYPGKVLSPEKILTMDITKLSDSFRFITNLTYHSFEPDENLYLLDKNKENIRLSVYNNKNRDIKEEIRDPKTGFIQHILSANKAQIELDYIGKNCQFTLGVCVETTRIYRSHGDVKEAKKSYLVEFSNGVWSMTFEEYGRSNHLYYIYDENGFLLYKSHFVEGNLKKEHVRVFDSNHGWLNLTSDT